MCFAPQRPALFQHLNFQNWLGTPQFLTHFDKIHNLVRLPRETTSEPPKVVRTPSVLNMFTSKCASRHNGVHFFNISTSKSGPNPSVFNTFYFQMCFAPQRRALFQHLNFQKWSEPPQFLTHPYFQMCFAPQRRALFQHLNFQKWSEPISF